MMIKRALVLFVFTFFLHYFSPSDVFASVNSGFKVPDGFELDLFYYEKLGGINFRREISPGKYAAISFRKEDLPIDLYTLEDIGFKRSEECGDRMLMIKQYEKHFELTSFVANDVYVHAVNLSRDEFNYLKSYLCGN